MSSAEQSKIEELMQGIRDAHEFLERTSHVLSLVSQNIGIAVAGAPKEVLEHIYFSRLGDQKVLAVLITRSGVVRDRVLRLHSDIPQSDLEIAAHYLNENFHGWSLENMRADIERRIEQERSEYDRLMRSIEDLYRQGALAGSTVTHDIYLEGAANLVGNADQERVRELLRTLEEKQRIVELLSAYLDARQESVRVVFGLEALERNLGDFVLIGAPARAEGEVVGSLAVIGPMRMDYQHTMTAVAYLSRLFEKFAKE